MIRIYGVDEDNYIVQSYSVPEHTGDAELETIARYVKRHFDVVGVWAMFDSKQLHSYYRDYCKNAYKRSGLGDIERFEFVDYIKSGDWELGKEEKDK